MAEDLTNRVFDNLTVLGPVIPPVPIRRGVKRYWLCHCICGTEKPIREDHLLGRKIVSCSCHRNRQNRKQPTGKDASNWKGGRRIDAGYVLIYNPEHHRAKSNGYVKEHIVVMEEKLGRPLKRGENVHHINGIRSDNRHDNLELWISSQPPGQRVKDLIKWAEEILKEYDSEGTLHNGGIT